MDWRALWADKRLRLGLLAAAGVGAVVWLRRRGAGTETGSTARPAGATGTSGGVAVGPDTTGTDIAAWMGQYSASLQGQLNDFSRQLTDSLEQLGRTTVVPGTPSPVARPAPSLVPSRRERVTPLPRPQLRTRR